MLSTELRGPRILSSFGGGDAAAGRSQHHFKALLPSLMGNPLERSSIRGA